MSGQGYPDEGGDKRLLPGLGWAWVEELEAEQARRVERAQKKIPKRAGAA